MIKKANCQALTLQSPAVKLRHHINGEDINITVVNTLKIRAGAYCNQESTAD